MSIVETGPGWELRLGDCRTVLATMDAGSIDAVVTDPPYELGFMGKKWDASGVAFDPATWAAVLRVLKPGGHMLAFSGTRTYHRMVCAIEDAGFEIRDQLAWMYATGFPKSLDVSKAIDAAAGAVREVIGQRRGQGSIPNDRGEWGLKPNTPVDITAPATADAQSWSGWGTALKPAHEPIVLARKPLIGTVAANVLAHGTGGLNIDACRIGWASDADKAAGRPASYPKAHEGFEGKSFAIADRSHRDPEAEQAAGRWPANVLLDEWLDPVLCLLDSAPEAVREFYADHEAVRGLRVADDNSAEPGAADALLLPSVLRGGAVEAAAHSASDAGPKAQQWIAGEDAREQGRLAERGSISGLEGGPTHESWVCALGVVGTTGARTGALFGDGDTEQPALHPRASPGNGTSPGSSAAPGRVGAPPQRNQERQPDRESGAARQRDAQAGAPSDRARVEGGAVGDRTIEVRASEVPATWLKYFRRTGDAIRCGAAAALDAQSGHGKSTVGKPRGAAAGDGWGMTATGREHSDSGGASRFFYVAKASRSEREAGLAHLPKHSAGELTDREDGSDGLKSPRTGAGRTSAGRANNHPTVKPEDVMQWLARLITPPGGIVLDPFAGSGTTGIACRIEGFRFIGIELEPSYFRLAVERLRRIDKELAAGMREEQQRALF